MPWPCSRKDELPSRMRKARTRQQTAQCLQLALLPDSTVLTASKLAAFTTQRCLYRSLTASCPTVVLLRTPHTCSTPAYDPSTHSVARITHTCPQPAHRAPLPSSECALRPWIPRLLHCYGQLLQDLFTHVALPHHADVPQHTLELPASMHEPPQSCPRLAKKMLCCCIT